MSDADDAYKEAQRLIAEALASGNDTLNLNTKETHALTTLPPEIADLTGITELNLDNTQVADLRPIRGITGITTLGLGNTMVSDITPLISMTGIRKLRLNSTQVSDIAALTGLLGITTIHLDHTQVSDIAPLSRMTRISKLNLDSTLVSDISPLAGMIGITRFSLGNTLVSDISSLAGMIGITRLNLANTLVSDISPLAGMIGITRLNLGSTQVSDISPLTDMTEITSLNLGSTQVSDLRVLLTLTMLGYEPASGGLNFKKTPATTMDKKLARLAKITDDVERSRKTYAYLHQIGDDWPPNQKRTPADRPDTPKPPAQIPAPLQAEFRDAVLAERPQPSDLSEDTADRARQGWEALSEFQADVAETMKKGNLPNLERAINAFGRALSDRFEDVRQIALGTHGQRIVEISRTAGDTLMDDAAGDLRAFAAAIDTHLQRFPEWVAYLQDDIVDADTTPPLGTVTDDLRDLSQTFQDTDFIADDLAQKFDDLVVAAEDKDLSDELAKKGVLRSLSNMLSPIAERAILATKKVGHDLGKEVYKRAIQGVAISGVGSVAGILLTKGQILVMLAEKYPATLGWLQSVLRYLGL